MLLIRRVVTLLLLGSSFFALPADGQLADLQKSIEIVNQIGPEGKGHEAAQAAWKAVGDVPIEGLEIVLAGIRDENPLAVNWLRPVAATIVDRYGKSNGQGTLADRLVKFVTETKNSPASRFAAFELLQQDAPQRSAALIPGMLNDQSLDLRRLAVAHKQKEAEQMLPSDKKAAAVAFKSALAAARDVDQIESLTTQLEELEEKVDLIQHFGFLTEWKLVGPFEHAGSTEFDTIYPPEKELPPRFDAEYDGKEGKIKWIDHTTEDELGIVDLNKALDKHKGAIAYAATKFVAKAPRDVEIRMGCINGNKIWLNGKLLTANEVYHSNIAIDQYVGRGTLRAGENWILVKVAQNEQTQSWAQRWQFQLRVCDALGTAYHAVAAK